MIEKTKALPAPKPRDPGIYFGLDEDDYHADVSLGSSDARNLFLSPPDYWWGSPYNPDREDDENDDTPSKVRGKAMHKLVLEGEAAFDKLYLRGPTHTRDMSPSEKGALTKAANQRAAAQGLTSLPAKDYDRIAITAAMITRNPHLAPAIEGGAREVSIFWRQPAAGASGENPPMVPCKARIDWLKPRGLGDLKSITNIKKIEFKRACRESIANYRYDMQAAHYMRGREHLARLVADGCVHGDCDPVLLKQIATVSRWAFQFIFFQASKAPVTYSTIITPSQMNPIWCVAEQHLDAAMDAWRDCMAKFGPTEPWLLLDKPGELDAGEMPAWFARR